MTRLAPVSTPGSSSDEQDRSSTAARGDAAGRSAALEQQLCDVRERAHKTLQRAVEAEQRACAGERRIDALLRAMDTRGPIDQAKGVLMAVFGLEPDAAFDALVWVSQNANVKLATVAERFMLDVVGLDLSVNPRDEVTYLLARIGQVHGAYFS
ncbi:ANTAR domain-containing protein [Actinomycetospora sp. TBRC 11914]|uniref:ANTAR domain-containing protein n=1 Tax=Actinomycetospora sp. TBRC 11914 TaxID=2729387 RepID=UPI00145E7B2C|nr:ANTAR domain-containing protein [Actinomycetospora sp. TBRC 11914]NMO90598.1 ANTAR domain-containing protein [Actinomycetospora sp. TBRC 11914]